MKAGIDEAVRVLKDLGARSTTSSSPTSGTITSAAAS
jgi:hypothetical protein